jgi:hypothetical protein
LGDNKKNLCDVNLIDTMEVIYKKWEHRSTTIGWKFIKAMERGKHIWCDKAKKQVHVEGHLHVEFAWLPCIWFIYKLLNQGLFGMFYMRARGGYYMFFTSENNMYIGHWHSLARGHPKGKIMLHSMDKLTTCLPHLEFLLLIFFKGWRNVKHGWIKDPMHQRIK